MISFEERLKNKYSTEKKVLELLSNVEYTHNNGIIRLQDINYNFAIKSFFIDNDLNKAKLYFNNCGLLDCFSVEKYNDRFLDYNWERPIIALLSDNEDLIERYSKLRYRSFYRKDDEETFTPLTMEEMVEDGEGAVWANTIQFFMANDMVGVEKNLNIIETKTKKNRPKNIWEFMQYDYEFYKALYYGDKAKMEEILDIFVSPKHHKERNDDPIFRKYISMPALGYAKLAWRKGIEVEVKSKLVPKELLPIQPLENYEIPYDFLKE